MSEAYRPYETTAKVIARGEMVNRKFLQSLFPDLNLTDADLYKFEHFVAGNIHDGIEYGMALSEPDPIAPLEAYRLGDCEGYTRGYEQAIKDLRGIGG